MYIHPGGCAVIVSSNDSGVITGVSSSSELWRINLNSLSNKVIACLFVSYVVFFLFFFFSRRKVLLKQVTSFGFKLKFGREILNQNAFISVKTFLNIDFANWGIMVIFFCIQLFLKCLTLYQLYIIWSISLWKRHLGEFYIVIFLVPISILIYYNCHLFPIFFVFSLYITSESIINHKNLLSSSHSNDGHRW